MKKLEQKLLGVEGLDFSTGEINSCLAPNIYNEFLHFDRIMLSGTDQHTQNPTSNGAYYFGT